MVTTDKLGVRSPTRSGSGHLGCIRELGGASLDLSGWYGSILGSTSSGHIEHGHHVIDCACGLQSSLCVPLECRVLTNGVINYFALQCATLLPAGKDVWEVDVRNNITGGSIPAADVGSCLDLSICSPTPVALHKLSSHPRFAYLLVWGWTTLQRATQASPVYSDEERLK